MKAEIISTGTELLLGEIVNANAAYIASQLPRLGIDIYFMSTVGDNCQRIIEVLDQAWQRSDIIITTGGLGPTQGDITRDAIAEFLHEQITIDETLVSRIRERFHKHNLMMSDNNLRQAGMIPSARSIPNSRGTAPGWWIERDNHILITLPGPTSEVHNMWQKEVAPALEKKAGSSVILSRTLKTFSLNESDVDRAVSAFMSSDNPTLAIYARTDGIQLRITAKAADKETAESLISGRETDIKRVLGQVIWGTDTDTIDSVTASILASRKLTLATMETETGGLLANTITNLSNSHTFYKGGLVVYSQNISDYIEMDNSTGSNHDTIHTGIALKMASYIRTKMGADIGIGITAVPVPDESAGIAAGSVFLGINDGTSAYTVSRSFPGQPFQVKQRAITYTFFELRKILLGEGK